MRLTDTVDLSDKFILAATEAKPFERIQFLRGTENIYIDLAMEKRMFELLKVLHSFYIKEISKWAFYRSYEYSGMTTKEYLETGRGQYRRNAICSTLFEWEKLILAIRVKLKINKGGDAMTTTRIPNRLLNESSPYLQQHAYNPVDWFPWGNEAFEKAKQEYKPIFLSIGYSTCHWCHNFN